MAHFMTPPMTSLPQRHDLLRLTAPALARMSAELVCADPVVTAQLRQWLVLPQMSMPGITRRLAPCDGKGIGLGFSFPCRIEGNRVRHASAVQHSEVAQVITPWQIVTHQRLLNKPYGEPLRQLLQWVNALGHGRVGVYGATALEMVTGLPYVDAHSDIDILLEGFTLAELTRLEQAIQEICVATRSPGLAMPCFDAEVIVANDWGVKLKELTCSQKTVLAKSINCVEIFSKTDPVIRTLD